MLAALDTLGVTGLAVLADGLHKPIAVDHPLLSPADFEGIMFTTRLSSVYADAVLALGADTEVAISEARTAGVQSGEIQGLEWSLLDYRIGEPVMQLAPYATANVNLWANPAVLIANPDTLDELTGTQREWVTQAAANAAERSTDLINHDADLLVELCGLGARFANASETDLTAMGEAFEPVYATLERDPQTADFIARIEALKETTDPGPALEIPEDCTGVSPLAAPPVDSEAAPTGDQSVLNGTYRWTLIPTDGTAEALFTVTLDDGIWTMRHEDGDGSQVDCEGADCTYTIDGDRIVFDWGYLLEWTFTVDEIGNLRLEPAGGQVSGDEFVWATKPWERIDGGAVEEAAAETTQLAGPATASGPVVEAVWQSTGGDDGLDFPGSMALDPQGQLWVADTGNDRFAIFTPDGEFVETWGSRGDGDGEFVLERSNGDGYGAVAFAPDGSFYVLDVGNHRVQKFAPDRTFVTSWGGSGQEPGTYTDPIGIAVDAAGTVYVIDDARDVVERYAPNGSVLGSFDAHPNTDGGLNTANSLGLDAAGNAYVSDIAPYQVEKFDTEGNLVATIGAAGSEDGHFKDQPTAIAVDDAGRVFVSEGPGGGRVQVFDTDGRFLASWGAEGQFPFGVVLDGQGNVYVNDAFANTVQKLHLLPPLAPNPPRASPTSVATSIG
jgi:sugar lactone lactonase YvrE